MKLADFIFLRSDYKITSPYGYRKNPITGEAKEFHDGCDYGTNAEKWPQYAIEEGEVLSCGKDSNYGNALFVWVKYPRLNIRLLHYHLDDICVEKGQKVEAGTLLGHTGRSGYATGIHLHLGLKYLNTSAYSDPEAFDYVPPVEIKSVERDLTKEQVKITYAKLNARNGANATKLGVYVPVGIYDILNKQKVGDDVWIEINDGIWCCLVEDCYELLPAESNDDYKILYEKKCEEMKKLYEMIGGFING